MHAITPALLRGATLAALAGAAATAAPPSTAEVEQQFLSTSTSCYPTVADWIPGDCDLDGDVDTDDFDIWYANYPNLTPVYGEVVTPRQGDTNWDGVVDTDDYLEIWNNLSSSIATIPTMDGVDMITTLDTSSGSNYGRLRIREDIDHDNVSDDPDDLEIKDDTKFYSTNLAQAHYTPPSTTDYPNGADTSPADGKVDALVIESDVQAELMDTFADGFDLKITVTNTDATYDRCVGSFRFDGFFFGESSTSSAIETGSYRNMRYGGKLVSDISHVGKAFDYPDEIYSPCQVLVVNGYTVGFSVQYPILEYQHDFSLAATRLQGSSHNWRFEARPERNSRALVLEPLESREYIVSVRIHKASSCDTVNDWMRTLRPYRRYFRALYGPVRYSRNPSPVSGTYIAQGAKADSLDTSPSNFFGFTGASSWWPSNGGFEDWIDEFVNVDASRGWGRKMLWAPSGSYDASLQVSFPPQFTSPWSGYMTTPDSDLIAYSNGTTRLLGLWWGRSGQYPDSWNDASLEKLDTFNSTHVAFAENEMDGATDAGADEIGLDALPHIPVWEAYWWLQYLQTEYPGVRFITEDQHCDLMHTLAPTFNDMSDSPSGIGAPYFLYSDGLLIQDFLNPGHEFWGRVDPRNLRKHLTGSEDPIGFDPEDSEPELQEIADLGMIPCYQGAVPTLSGGACEAAETWTTEVPVDLR